MGAETLDAEAERERKIDSETETEHEHDVGSRIGTAHSFGAGTSRSSVAMAVAISRARKWTRRGYAGPGIVVGMKAWGSGLGILVLCSIGCSSGSGSGGGAGATDGGLTGGMGGSTTGGTGGSSTGGSSTGGSSTGGSSTGGVSGAGGGPTGGSGGVSGAGTGGASGAGASGGSSGSSGGCQSPSECPGVDSECGTRTCVNQTCGFDAQPSGFVVSTQTPGDCAEKVCDGLGQIVDQADVGDVPNDNNDCTLDTCSGSTPQHTPKAPGTSCIGAAGAKVCNSAPACVECIAPGDCASAVCTAAFTCAQSSCTDLTKNGSESDVDCGGPCPKCQVGQACNTGTDCSTNACGSNGKCTCNSVQGIVILSEVRTRGPLGAADDFVELYNPGNTSVTLTSNWVVESRSETAANYTVRFTGAGQVVPPNRHLLIVGTAYSGSVSGDATLTSGITDESSVVLRNGATVVDAVCLNCGANNYTDQICQGSPVTLTGCANNVDRSIERKPGGPNGNCVDTNDANDWQVITPSIPQNLASAPAP